MKQTPAYRSISSIKMWAEDDRPREKLLLKGKGSLSDAELLAILIGSGYRDKSALDLARELLSVAQNDWHILSKFNVVELTKLKGLGPVKAISIIAALEIGKRKEASVIPSKTKVRNSKMIYDHLKATYQGLNHEEFYVIYLNFANEILDTVQLSKGGMTSTIVDGKVLFQHALSCQATGFIVCHNHPSGNRGPSDADKKLTYKLRDFAKLIDLQLIDHLIFTDNGYFSFADEGLL
ncbi:MAG: DNA repair protein RadC [Flavobacteriales bacterium]